jgi:hypothetical protein
MNVSQSLAQPCRIENSAILAATWSHTVPSNLERNSLKTHDSDMRRVTHNSQARESGKSGR